MKKRIIKLSESQLTNLVKKIINEVGGYDDHNVMVQHSVHSMEALIDSYNDLSSIMSGLANSISRGDSKKDISENLMQFRDFVIIFIDVMDKALEDFTEDDLILQAKSFKKYLKSHLNKLNLLITTSLDMGDDVEYKERVGDLVMELLPNIRKYSEKLKLVNDRFEDRVSNFKSGFFGFKK